VVAKFQRIFSQSWRVVFALATLLTVPLTVAVHRLKEPFIYAGSINLTTDGHRLAQMLTLAGVCNRKSENQQHLGRISREEAKGATELF
jgi:hypothetical protein